MLIRDIFHALRSSNPSKDFDTGEEIVLSYYLPMLTEHEMKLLSKKDESYFSTFQEKSPDPSAAEMAESISTRKYSFWECWRSTQILQMKN